MSDQLSDSLQQLKARTRQRTLFVIATCAAIVLICAVILAISLNSSGGSQPTATNASPTQTDALLDEADTYAPQQTNTQLLSFIKELTRNDSDDPRALGSIDAPVVMLEFADFSCPMCYRFQNLILPQLQSLIDDGTLRIEYHNLLIFDQDYQSSLGAKASVAAANQGKFWEFAQATAQFSQEQEESTGDSHITWTDQIALQIATNAGVTDLDKFQTDYTSDQTSAQVTQESLMSGQLGLTGTPSFLINDRFLQGTQEASVFKTVIAAAKAQAS